LIQVFTRTRNIDSRVRTSRFDCFKFEFHSGAAATFATVSALSVISLLRNDSVAFGCEADMRTVDRSNQSDVNDPKATSAKSKSRTAAVHWCAILVRSTGDTR